MPKLAILLGGVSALLAVLFGAFGAHGLKSRLTEDMLGIYQTGVQYHFYHSLGLILIGLVAWHMPGSPRLRWAAWIMLAGILLFSGSLYALALTNAGWLGMITPFGGLAFIGAWLLLVIAVYTNR
jgi:uncharacterized membrane protein YgdD (TMEM256/DUF423 family)